MEGCDLWLDYSYGLVVVEYNLIRHGVKFLPKLKGKFFWVVVRSTLLYGIECWPIKKKDENCGNAYVEVDEQPH